MLSDFARTLKHNPPAISVSALDLDEFLQNQNKAVRTHVFQE